MLKLNLSLLTIISLLIMLSCGSDDPIVTSADYNCEFDSSDTSDNGIIDEEERRLMDFCINQAFTTKSDIEKNLIGEWGLIGYGAGWVVSTPQPCGLLTITDDKLMLDFISNYSDTTTVHDWSIEEVSVNDRTYFNLKVEPYSHEMAIVTFCENYMFGDATPLDGNMYLYQKIK